MKKEVINNWLEKYTREDNSLIIIAIIVIVAILFFL